MPQRMTPEEQATRIAELEAQVAALKKIAEEERAAMLACAEDLHGIDEGHLIEARRQLAEEHPEAFYGEATELQKKLWGVQEETR